MAQRQHDSVRNYTGDGVSLLQSNLHDVTHYLMLHFILIRSFSNRRRVWSWWASIKSIHLNFLGASLYSARVVFFFLYFQCNLSCSNFNAFNIIGWMGAYHLGNGVSRNRLKLLHYSNSKNNDVENETYVHDLHRFIIISLVKYKKFCALNPKTTCLRTIYLKKK